MQMSSAEASPPVFEMAAENLYFCLYQQPGRLDEAGRPGRLRKETICVTAPDGGELPGMGALSSSRPDRPSLNKEVDEPGGQPERVRSRDAP